VSTFNITARIEDDYGLELDSLSVAMIQSISTAVGGLARAAQDHWISLAQTKLKSSRADYINGLRQAESYRQRVTASTQSFEITLVGRMPNNFEFGMPSFDMKSVRPGWLGGAKARRAKDGSFYTVIPFRHSTSSETNLDYTGKARAISSPSSLKSQLRSAVKEYGLDRMVKTATGQVVKGAVSKIPNKAPVHPYLQGVTRIQNTKRGGGGQSQLMSFRVMSENSDPSSWIHPGIRPANLLPEVEKWVDNQLDRILETILS
jgi:hypothetical protein